MMFIEKVSVKDFMDKKLGRLKNTTEDKINTKTFISKNINKKPIKKEYHIYVDGDRFDIQRKNDDRFYERSQNYLYSSE